LLRQPDEIAEGIAFLGGRPCSSFMPGSELYVDGGWTAL
jgi:NAD(P)-dependent dehydrogenase (short-subunit alcohol dehydrogenase family)